MFLRVPLKDESLPGPDGEESLPPAKLIYSAESAKSDGDCGSSVNKSPRVTKRWLMALAGLVWLVAITTAGYYHSHHQEGHKTITAGLVPPARFVPPAHLSETIVEDRVATHVGIVYYSGYDEKEFLDTRMAKKRTKRSAVSPNVTALEAHPECLMNCTNVNPCYPHCVVLQSNPDEEPPFEEMRRAQRLEMMSHVDPNKTADKRVYTGGATRMFLNVPYAVQPSSSAKNFEYAIPIEEPKDKPLPKQKNREFGPPCPQYLDNSMARKSVGTFKCLHLNVFAPLYPPANGSLPVMVFFHGGQLVRGAASDLGVNGLAGTFVKRGVVVVTANYRIGAIGFYKFATRDEILPTRGKNTTIDELRGLHDQLLVLKYVHDNIHHFNGDPARVTVAGHDGSACTVAYLALVASAQPMYEFHGVHLTDLFERAIMMSGSIGTCISYVDSPSQDYNHSRCVGELGPEATRAKAWEFNCLVDRQSDSQGYVDSYIHRFPLNWKLELPFGEMFLQPNVLKTMAMTGSSNGTKQLHRKSILMGYASHDSTEIYNMVNNTMSKGLFNGEKIGHDIYNFSMLQKLISNVTHERDYHGLAVNASADLSLMNSTELVNDLKQRYLKRFKLAAEPPMDNTAMVDTRWEMFFLLGGIKALTEGFYTVPLLNDARTFNRLGHDVYLYKFDTKPPKEFIDGETVFEYVYEPASTSGLHVVPFGTEMPYLFKQDRYWMSKSMLIRKQNIELHQKTTDDMADMWVNFINYGYPLPATGDRLNPSRDLGRFTCDDQIDPADCASFVQIGKPDKEKALSEKAYGNNKLLYLLRGNYITRGVETAWRKWGDSCDSDQLKVGNCSVLLHYEAEAHPKSSVGPPVPTADAQAIASTIAVVHGATSKTPASPNEAATSTASATGQPPTPPTGSSKSTFATVSAKRESTMPPTGPSEAITATGSAPSETPASPTGSTVAPTSTVPGLVERLLAGTEEEPLAGTKNASNVPPVSPTGGAMGNESASGESSVSVKAK